jgi:putative protease
MEEKRIGKVTHYYSHLGVGIVKIEQEGLKVGDTVHFKGHTTDFQQTVDSMQIEHKDVQEARVNEQVGIKVKEHVREHDEVFKVIG